MYPGSSVADLSAIDAALKGMELQVQKIKDRLREETQAIPKAKVFSELHDCDYFILFFVLSKFRCNCTSDENYCHLF